MYSHVKLNNEQTMKTDDFFQIKNFLAEKNKQHPEEFKQFFLDIKNSNLKTIALITDSQLDPKKVSTVVLQAFEMKNDSIVEREIKTVYTSCPTVLYVAMTTYLVVGAACYYLGIGSSLDL